MGLPHGVSTLILNKKKISLLSLLTPEDRPGKQLFVGEKASPGARSAGKPSQNFVSKQDNCMF